MKYKTKNAKIGAKALRRYHRKKKRYALLRKRPDILLVMVSMAVMIPSLITVMTNSRILGYLTFGLCVALIYAWLKGM